MGVQTGCDATWCRWFPTTLKGLALTWFTLFIPQGSITCFLDLETLFVDHFHAGRRHEKSNYSLMSVRQGEKETLRNYVKRFRTEALKVTHLEDGVAFAAFIAGLAKGPSCLP